MTAPPPVRRAGFVLAAALVVLSALPGRSFAAADPKKPEPPKTEAPKPDAPRPEPPKPDGSKDKEGGGKNSSPLYIHIETRNILNYAGDPNDVTILFQNDAKENWTNPGIEIEAGFQVYDEKGNKLEKTKNPTSAKEAQPKVLEPKGYFGKILDLNTLFPKMNAVGTYKITWSQPGLP